MELWFTEKANDYVGLSCRVREILTRKQSIYQEITVMDTKQFGKILLLDGVLQTTTKDEFAYHEMISHVPLNSHPNPRKVAVIGGGDGGTVREIVKHKSIEKVVLVEIDADVINISKQYLPEIAGGLDDQRVEILIADGIDHIQKSKNVYDIIIIDSTDPVSGGPAFDLFTSDFYTCVYEALTKDGIMVTQTESPYYEPEAVQHIYKAVSKSFPITRLYLAYIPTYPSGMWSFTLGSKSKKPEAMANKHNQGFPTKYYTPDIHKAAFSLPVFVQNLITEK